MGNVVRKLAVVTGASSGTGLELARLCARNNYDLVIAAADPSVFDAAQELAALGVIVSPVRCNLSAPEGIDALRDAITAGGRPADILIANAELRPLGRDRPRLVRDAHAYIDDTICLIDQVSRGMRGRGRGRILINLQAVPAGNDTFLDYFSVALRRELKHSGLSVTCLLPAAGRLELSDEADSTQSSEMLSGTSFVNGIVASSLA